MPYDIQTWSDYPSGGTPISAARLNHMEDGIAAAMQAAEDGTNSSDALTVAQGAAALAGQVSTVANAAKAASDSLSQVIQSTATQGATGWSVNRGNLVKVGKMCACELSLTRTGSAISVGASGNLTNLAVCTVPNDFVPFLNYSGISAGPGGSIASYYIQGNTIYLAAYSPSSTIATGNEITIAGPWLGK